jgi:RNA polymerase sigma factor (sigma-70 family)
MKELNREQFISKVYKSYGTKLLSYSINTWKVNEDIGWALVYKTIWKAAEVYKNYSFETEERFASFLFRIFINYLRNHYRDNKAVPETLSFSQLSDNVDPKENVSEPSAENLKLRALNEALEEMEDWQRLLLLLRSEGRPYSEIATYVDKPENQLKVYYGRLKEQITKKLHEKFK